MSKITEGTLVPVSLIALVGGALATSMIYVIANITKLDQNAIAGGVDLDRHEKMIGVITVNGVAIKEDLSALKATQLEILRRLDRMDLFMQSHLK